MNFLLFTFLLGLASPASSQKNLPQWTLFYYFAGDNNLERDIRKYQNEVIKELKQMNKPYLFNVAIQADYFDSTFGVKRYYFFGETFQEELYGRECDMADGQELVKFIQAGLEKIGPTSNYSLIILSHGLGWHGVVRDDHPSGWIDIPTEEWSSALGEIRKILGKNIDVLYLFACQMQIWEVQEEMKDMVDLTIGSWMGIPCDGIKIDYLLRFIKNPNISPESLAVAMAKSYSFYRNEEYFSALRTSEVGQLSRSINDLALCLNSSPDVVQARVIGHLLTCSTEDLAIIDLAEFAQKLKNDSLLSGAIREAAAGVEENILKVVLFKPDATSLNAIGIYHPVCKQRYENPYSWLFSSLKYSWDDYLKNIKIPCFWFEFWDSDEPFSVPDIPADPNEL